MTFGIQPWEVVIERLWAAVCGFILGAVVVLIGFLIGYLISRLVLSSEDEGKRDKNKTQEDVEDEASG